jgi:hypothetical protein
MAKTKGNGNAEDAKAMENMEKAGMLEQVPLFKLLAGFYATKIPVIVWSDPGLGKTATVEFLAKVFGIIDFVDYLDKLREDKIDKEGFLTEEQEEDLISEAVMSLRGKRVFIHKNASQMTEYETGGIAHLDKNNNAKISAPSYIKLLQTKGGILFIDEISRAPESTQNMLLSLVQEGICNEFHISKQTFSVMCGNYDNDVGSGVISLAMSNRCANVHLEYDPIAHCDGWESGWMNYEQPIIETDSEKILQKETYYVRQCCDFIRAHTDAGHNMPKDIVVKEDVSWPSPRTWELVTKALAILDANDDLYVETIIRSIVGVSAGTLFFKFLKNKKQVLEIDLTQYVGKENTIRFPDPNKHDQVYHIVKQSMYLLSKNPKKFKDLAISVMNLCHNKDDKFGKYSSYDGFPTEYLKSVLQVLLNEAESSAEKSKVAIELNKRIDDWQELYATGMTKS